MLLQIPSAGLARETPANTTTSPPGSPAGASGPAPKLFEKFGFTKERIAAEAAKTIEYYSTHPCHSLFAKPDFKSI